MQHAADSKHCRNCGHAYEYDAVYLAHMGRYRCPNCGRERPTPAVAAEKVTLRGMQGTAHEGYDGTYQVGPITASLPADTARSPEQR